MKNRFFRALIASLVMSSFLVTTLFAAPDASAIKEKRDAAQSEVNSVQAELTKVLTQINKLEEKLIETGEQVTKATEDLEAAEKKEQQQYEDMKCRIKYMYEVGDNMALEKIAKSGSIAELLSQAEYVQEIHKYDREQLNEYAKTKKKIANLKEQLEKDMKKLEKDQKDFETKKADLNSTLEEKRAEVDNLDEQFQKAVEQAAREAEAKRKREEEEARRQEALNRPSNPSRPSAPSGGQGGSGSAAGSGSTSGGSTSGGNTSKPGGSTSGGNASSGSNTSGGSQSTGNKNAAQAIVNAAYSQLGTPYVWGGTTPGVGLDCSGLTQYCHRVAGISIPRTSGPQGGGGKAVTNPQPGDIVCYSGHVGIYIGGGKMIHAPQPGDVVKIQSVYGTPWYRRYW